MLLLWSPMQLLLLASVALVVAFFAIGEMIEQRHPRRPARIPTESERLAWAMRHVPRGSREDLRKSLVAPETKQFAPDQPAQRQRPQQLVTR